VQKIIELKTERLLLRQWQPSDLALFSAMNADPLVMNYYPSTLSPNESNALAQRFTALINKQSWGMWAVEILEQQEFIGFVGLHKPQYPLPVTDCTEIGWRLAQPHWGKGYATEAAKTALQFAFETLSLNEVYSFTSVINYRSQAVMQRLKMNNTHIRFNHPMLPKGHTLSEHILYEISNATVQSAPLR